MDEFNEHQFRTQVDAAVLVTRQVLVSSIFSVRASFLNADISNLSYRFRHPAPALTPPPKIIPSFCSRALISISKPQVIFNTCMMINFCWQRRSSQD